MKKPHIYLSFLWHMHQPYYRNVLTGTSPFPWVRLHAVKDYYDMVAILEKYPQIHQTFNLVPSLVEQIEEYTDKNCTDDFLELSRKPATSLSQEDKVFILDNFFLVNWENMVKPFPRYFELLKKRGFNVKKEELSEIQRYFTVQDFLDLQVWFNLVWIDPIHRNQYPEISALFDKGNNFTEDEKQILLDKQIEIMRKIIPMYKKMQQNGQIEISVSPYYHPILPLLIDNYIAKVSNPQITLPKEHFQHPEDAKAQIEAAVEFYTNLFGMKPKGMWPSEGSVSEDLIPLISQAGIKWIATDEGILLRSLNLSKQDFKRDTLKPNELYRPYLITKGEDTLCIIFRDRTLSDLISFTYMRLNAKKAAFDFINRLNEIHQKVKSYSEDLAPLVLVALDGENAWEHYPNDGHDFFKELYTQLSNCSFVKCVTISEYLENHPPINQLTRLYPGSWINSDFSIWIGHQEDNTAWDFLAQTRKVFSNFYKKQSIADSEKIKLALKSLYAAEGSDWFWWYGPPFHTPLDYLFDEVFRAHLSNVYKVLDLEIPAVLSIPIKKVLRKEYMPLLPVFLSPDINGKEDGYYEWADAARYEINKNGPDRLLEENIVTVFWVGFDRNNLYFRLDLHPSVNKEHLKDIKIYFNFLSPNYVRGKITFSKDLTPHCILMKKFNLEQDKWEFVKELPKVAFEKILELAIPFADIEAHDNQEVEFQLVLEKKEVQVQRFPTDGVLVIPVPPKNYEEVMWSV